MGSRTISLEDSAYESLKAAKQPGESFSQTVRRLVAPRESPLRRLAGAWSAEKADAVGAAIQENREFQQALSLRRWQERGWL